MSTPLPLLEGELPVDCCTSLRATSLSDDEAAATATLFKALGDPHRVRIVNLLSNAGGPICVCDITELLGLAQATVSFHLKKLTSAGLITREQRGTWAYYGMDPKSMQTLRKVAQ